MKELLVALGVALGGLVLFAALTVGVLLIAAMHTDSDADVPVPSTNPVVQDRLGFTSVEARTEFEDTFWAVVDPIRKFPAPVVPGDGGGARWTS